MKRLSTKSPIRAAVLTFVAGGMLLAASSGAFGAANQATYDAHRRQQEAQQQAAPPPPPPQQQQRPSPPQNVGDRGGNGNRRWEGRGQSQSPQYGGGQYRGDRRVITPGRPAYTPNSHGYPSAYRPRPPRYAPSLPSAHRRYDWRGTPYYYGGGHWYRPYQNRYVIVGAPVGLFVDSLHGPYSTVWVGGTRYYYSDNVYYTYEPARRGYVVSRSPYGDDDEGDEDYGDRSDDSSKDQDMFIYPMRGQNEQQQSDDRYECHRWAAKETSYDPTDSGYDREKRENYDRAMTACLTGRGYSVK